MTLELGIVLTLGMVLFALVALVMSSLTKEASTRRSFRLEQFGAFLVIAMSGLTLCALVLDEKVGWIVFQVTAYTCILYGLLGSVLSARALHGRYKR